ncbi:MAG: T9SS type A sorting domain-containing protein [Bacteroidetes bacterium]|nr:T9SS type A sorting domain-containing protein [Bacteroidota bacterium]
MKTKKNTLLFISIIPTFLFSQTNLIHNPGFENGSGTPVSESSCQFGAYVPGTTAIDNYIYDWKLARCTDSWPSICDYKYSEPDWKGPDYGCSYLIPSHTRFMYLEKRKYGTTCHTKSGEQDAVRSPLISTMDGTKNYLFRINYEGLNQFFPNTDCQPDAPRTRIYFSKNSSNWHAKWGNTKLSFAMYPPYSFVQHWVILNGPRFNSIPFIGNIFDKLKNITIACEDGAFYVDYVELAEMCEDPLLIQNHVFYYGVNEVPYKSSGILKAGNNVGAPTATGDVIIKNSAVTIFKAETAIYLEPGFRTENNAHFETIIENCNTNTANRMMAPNIQMLSKNNYVITTEDDIISIEDDHIDTLACRPDTLKIYGLDGDTISFTNYWWDYGNGTTSTDKVAKILYTQSGDYLVRLALTDSTGFTDTLSKIYVVPDCNNLRRMNQQQLTAEEVAKNNFETAITITPNPTSGVFVLHINDNTPIEVFIYNNIGQLIYQSTIINGQSSIDLSTQPRGIYFVKVQSADPAGAGKIYTEKVVVQ